jgi:hypothetical protein
MPTIDVDWEWFEFKPPALWLNVKRAAAKRTKLKISTLNRCVYVVRISHTYCIEYRLRASPTLYIGRGHFRARITKHLDWINELSEVLRDLEIQVWFFTPRVQRTSDAYKTVEADLIEEFVKENGSVPMFNTRRPKPLRRYEYRPLQKFRHAVIQGKGSKYPWSLRPNSSDRLRELFDANYHAEPAR